jgi:hypothetical protein
MMTERSTWRETTLALLASAMMAACPNSEAMRSGGRDAALRDAAGAASGADGSRPALSDAEAMVTRPTHTGLVSIQEITIANLPALAPGVTVNAFLNGLVAPDYDEHPGQVAGCRAWAYDLIDRPPAPQQDHGVLNIAGVGQEPLTCAFQAERGYGCAADRDAQLPSATFGPFLPDAQVTISLQPGGHAAFERVEATLKPGAAFTLDRASSAAIQDVPLTGQALSLSCEQCGVADVTIVRITSSDGELLDSSPVTMPAPKRKSVEIQCVALAGGHVVVPAAAMQLLADTHRTSPATRIRTAFMRDALKLVTNQPPSAPNQLAIVVGHGVLGFTTPQAPSQSP